MSHAGIEQQIASYWETLRDGRPVPYRSEVDPRGLEGALEHMFILERTAPGQARFRVAGMRLNSFMGMEVRGMDIASLFEIPSRGEISNAFSRLFEGPARLAIPLAGNLGRVAAFPLRGPSGAVDRAMGCIVGNLPDARAGQSGPGQLDIAHVELTPIRLSALGPHEIGHANMPGFCDAQTPYSAAPQGRPQLRLIRNQMFDD